MQFFKDLSPSAFTAGFVAVLVGFTSSVAIVFQAALAFNATPEIITSWMWALGLGMGLCSLLPSLWLKKPVMVAWSTPGAAVLATAGVAGGFNMNEAVGAFMISAVLIALCGATGLFERVMNRIPMGIASALLAGVLARFGLQGFLAVQTALPLVLVMFATYLIARRWLALYAVPITLLVAIVFVALTQGFTGAAVQFELAMPIFIAPSFSWAAAISLALPLFVVTMASQNLPGVAAIQAAGYAGKSDGIPISKIITLTGLATLVLAPFGAFALCLSAITAAICMGKDAHPDPAKRYTASASCGALYLLIGVFGAAITGVLSSFPKELIAAIAGLALLGTIGNALATAVKEESHREASLITFLVTLSGLQIAGVGSAFWGVVAGALALFVQNWAKPRPKTH
jgi:benzoate membrane transport protein